MRAQIIFLAQLYSGPASLAPSIQSGSQLSMGLPVITMAPANRDRLTMKKSSLIDNDLRVVFESYNLNAEEQQVVADLMNCCLAGYLTPDQVGTCLKLRGGDDGLVRFLVRILWIWVMAQNLGQTEGFQPIKPIYPGIPGQGQPYPRIAAKVQKTQSIIIILTQAARQSVTILTNIKK